jgi:hypothetical protein
MTERNLADRLPLEISKGPRERELYEAIDEYFTQRLMPTLQRTRNMRSVFTAHADDLTRKLEELTAYFDYAGDELTKPLSIFWKQNEINNKNNEWAIEALVQRLKIQAKDIIFDKLYAPKDTVTFPYGTIFYTMEDLVAMEVDLNDYFLSSHMALRIDYNEVLENDWDEEELRAVVERYFEENVRPNHIVFDGLNFQFMSDIIESNYSMNVQPITIVQSRLMPDVLNCTIPSGGDSCVAVQIYSIMHSREI